jgi:hypothetical protein
MIKTMKTKLFFLILLVCIISCKNKKQDKSSVLLDKDQRIDSLFSSKFTKDLENQDEFKSEEIKDTVTEFEFKDLKVSISRLTTYEEDSIKEKSSKSDTVLFYIDLAESIEGQKLLLESNTLENLKAEMSYQTSVSIQNEGPHCDLNNWKHYTSSFIELVKTSQNEFQISTFEEKDYSKFPQVNIEELKKTIKKECGEDWYKLVQKIKTPNDYPSEVSISRYILKLSGTEKKNKTIKVKIIIIESPMGC